MVTIRHPSVGCAHAAGWRVRGTWSDDARRAVTAPAFGPYRVLELLGRGGMGTVHRAYDTEHRRMVALKRLPDRRVDERFRARFRREARIAAGLRHPHAVPVHAFGEIDGQLYLDMMLVEGTDLRRMLGTGAVDPQRAVAVLGQIARRWTRRTQPAWCTATSSRRTSWSTRPGTPTSPTSASPARPPRTPPP